MTRIINFNYPVDITFNEGDRNFEFVFKLNQDNTFENGFTFGRSFSINDIDKFNNSVKNANQINIDNGFLFYSYGYQSNYGHYMTQNVPKLIDYLINYSSYKLLIPIYFYNLLTKDILSVCKINPDNIYVLEDSVIYNVNNLVKINDYAAPPSYPNQNSKRPWRS